RHRSVHSKQKRRPALGTAQAVVPPEFEPDPRRAADSSTHSLRQPRSKARLLVTEWLPPSGSSRRLPAVFFRQLGVDGPSVLVSRSLPARARGGLVSGPAWRPLSS